MLPLQPLQEDNTDMKKVMFWTLLCLLHYALPAWALPALAEPQQSHTEIVAAIENFVRAQTIAMPGKVDIRVGEIDRRIKLPACQELETFLPPGGKLIGNSTVGARCSVGSKWTIFVPVRVKISSTLLIANKPLLQGQEVRAEDLASQSGELVQASMLTDPAEAIGKVLKYSVGAGQVLKKEMLRIPFAIKEGQAVQLQVEGEGYIIKASGLALNNSAEGESARVRTTSGQVVNGVARAAGIVEVAP